MELSEQEWAHILAIEAEDQQLRHTTLLSLRRHEEELEREAGRREAVSSAPNFHSTEVCVLCCSSFSLFARGQPCAHCSFHVCKSCLLPLQPAPICRFCEKSRAVKQKRREWARFATFSPHSFGILKLLTPSRPSCPVVVNLVQYGWKSRVSLELVLKKEVGPLDDVLLTSTLPGKEVEKAGGKVEEVCVELVKEGGGQGPELAPRLRPSLHLLRVALKTAEEENLGPVPSSTPTTYERLLVAALITKLWETIGEWREGTPSLLLSSSPSSSLDDALFHAGRHKVRLPSIVDSDLESPTETEDKDSVGSAFAQNWFFKGISAASPEGSVRSQCSQRVPSSMRALIDSFHQADIALSLDEPGFGEEGEKDEEEAGDPPSFLQKPQAQTAHAGRLVQFVASLAGTEPIDVYWYSSTKELEDQGRHRMSCEGREFRLEIFDAEPSDSGEIVCLAVNEVSVASTVAELRVKDADIAGTEPEFSEELEGVVGREGEEVWMECLVLGFPLPRVSFHRNNTLIQPDDRIRIERWEDGRWRLGIRGARVEDSGHYSALAKNRLGQAMSRTLLSIVKP